jgi:hypothetical protein
MRWNWSAGRPVLSPQEQDRIFYGSFSAGLNNFTVTSRLEYIYNAGRADELRRETDYLRAHLKKNVQQLPNTWLMDALYAAREGDLALAESSLARYLAMAGNTSAHGNLVVDLIRQELAIQSRASSQADKGAAKDRESKRR